VARAARVLWAATGLRARRESHRSPAQDRLLLMAAGAAPRSPRDLIGGSNRVLGWFL
jgi:hypothetical protein